MFICKKCGTKKRILNQQNSKCKKCGYDGFTSKEMMRAEKRFNLVLSKDKRFK